MLRKPEDGARRIIAFDGKFHTSNIHAEG
jgi:hypothetical protein